MLIRTILGMEDLEVESMEVQKPLVNLNGRSLTVDIVARDADGGIYNFEIQRSDEGASPQRARYHASLLDSYYSKSSEVFPDLPEVYVVFITENDIYRANEPFYLFDRTCKRICRDLDDGTHILYLNGRYRGNDAIGRLMHDFNCSNANEMLKERVWLYKNNEEYNEKMCRSIEELCKEREATGEARGMARGEVKGERNLGLLIDKLLSLGRTDDVKAASTDPEARQRLYKEFGIA